MEKEIRSAEIRTTEDSRVVEGYALVFDSLSEDLGGFREKISPEAIDGIVEKSDILALLNHDRNRGVLARSRYGKGSLVLEVDEFGLKYRFDSPNTALGDELLEYLKRGDITSSSFAFKTESDVWEKQADGTYIRTITKFKELYDVSPVFEPAYQATSVCKRFAEIQEEEQRQLEEIKRQEDEKRAKELEEYYSNLKEENKTYLNID
jgi:HK97 family phage prohead protease